MRPQPFPLHPTRDNPPPAAPPRSESPQASARGISEPLIGREEEWQSVVTSMRREATEWRPALAWAMGAVGAGLCQSAVAVASRPDAGVAQMSTAGTAMAAGTWLYAQGVRRLVRSALEGHDGAWPGAGVSAGSWVGAILGVGLATVPVGPVRMAGIGLDVLASQGLHKALTDNFIASERALGRETHLRQHGSPALDRSTAAIIVLALLSLAGSAVAVTNVARLGSAEAAGAGLLCHALIGSSLSAFFGLRAWQRLQEAQSPRRGWQSP